MSLATKHIVLVHGSCHGAWCYYKLIAELKSCGHRVTAVDLGACGINSKRVEEVDSFSDYMQPLVEVMASLSNDEKVVLVGHSYGGLPISLAMEMFPEKILVAVFISAYMPNHMYPPNVLIQEFFKGTKAETFMDCEFTFGQGQDNPPTSVTFGPQYIESVAYQHCKPEDVELAKVLVRPSGLFLQDMSKEGLLTEQKFGSVRRVFVVCEGDKVVPEEFQRWMINVNPPEKVKVIKDCGHMVMLSKPKELRLCINEISKE